MRYAARGGLVTASLLPLPDDPRFSELIASWGGIMYPVGVHRSLWLGEFERLLRQFYPSANARSLSLTARHYAPFYLAEGHDVP